MGAILTWRQLNDFSVATTDPNLYAIRGTAYRDVLNWSESVAKMAELAGGTLAFTEQMESTLAKLDYQGALELSDDFMDSWR